MVRPKNVGMNRPEKKRVVVPSLPEVRLLVRGYVPEPTREPDCERGQPAAAEEQASPGKLLVSRLERYAYIKGMEAKQAGRAYDRAIAKRELDERVYEAKIRSLEGRTPSFSLSVLDKREQQLRDTIEDNLRAEIELMAARAANAEAFLAAFAYESAAKTASIRRLQRLLARAKK